VFPGSVDSGAAGRAANESFSASSSVVGVSIPGRIMGYDVARAIAVIGMVIVNYHNIFLVGRSRHPHWFTGLAFFLQGRAAAIFVMLAGVGITLMSHKALLSGDALLFRKVRQDLLKRSLVLFLIGLVFFHWWNSDILHFYGIFLSTGALLLFVSGFSLWFLIGGCLIVATFLFIFYEASPTMIQVLLPANPISELFDGLLISGQYSLLPWFSFFMVGMWLGRPEIISNRQLIQRVFWISLLVLFLTIGLANSSDFILDHFQISQDNSPLALLLLSVPFPMSPFFAISAMAGALVVIIMCIILSDHPLFLRPFNHLAVIGKMSLTIYIGHIFVGLIVEHITFSKLALEEFQLFTVGFTFLFCLIVFGGTKLWFRQFARGPLEWLLRRLSQYL
jgi:uncharacterized protein